MEFVVFVHGIYFVVYVSLYEVYLKTSYVGKQLFPRPTAENIGPLSVLSPFDYLLNYSKAQA